MPPLRRIRSASWVARVKVATSGDAPRTTTLAVVAARAATHALKRPAELLNLQPAPRDLEGEVAVPPPAEHPLDERPVQQPPRHLDVPVLLARNVVEPAGSRLLPQPIDVVQHQNERSPARRMPPERGGRAVGVEVRALAPRARSAPGKADARRAPQPAPGGIAGGFPDEPLADRQPRAVEPPRAR